MVSSAAHHNARKYAARCRFCGTSLGHAGTGVAGRHYTTPESRLAGLQGRALGVLQGGRGTKQQDSEE